MTSTLLPDPDGDYHCQACADNRSDRRCHTHHQHYCDTCHPCTHQEGPHP